MADERHPITGEQLMGLEKLATVHCSVCGRFVSVYPGVTEAKCLEHSPEYWEEK